MSEPKTQPAPWSGKRPTGKELAEILAAHRAWAVGQAVGKRADLRGAYLLGAYLHGVTGVLCVGPCDSWLMYAVQHDDGPRIQAGCHWFTVDEARKYWAPENHSRWTRPDAEHGERMLAGLDALLALSRAHGWTV